MIGQIGGFLGGAGQFAGGLSSLFGNNDNGVSTDDIRESMAARFYAARNYAPMHGFHPLVGLGINPSSSPMYAGGYNDVGRGLEAMGQGLERMSNTGMSEVQKAQIENLKARTNLINKQAEEVGKDAPLNTGQNAPISEVANPPGLYRAQQLPKQAPGGGRQLGEQGAEKVMFNPEGYMITAPAEGLEDLVSDDIVAKIRFYLPQWQRMAKGYSTHSFESNQDTPAAVQFRNATRLYLVGLEKSHPPPKGMMYVWDLNQGTVKRVPKKKFHRLFNHSTKWSMKAEFVKPKSLKRGLGTSYREYYNKKMWQYDRRVLPLKKSH